MANALTHTPLIALIAGVSMQQDRCVAAYLYLIQYLIILA